MRDSLPRQEVAAQPCSARARRVSQSPARSQPPHLSRARGRGSPRVWEQRAAGPSRVLPPSSPGCPKRQAGGAHSPGSLGSASAGDTPGLWGRAGAGHCHPIARLPQCPALPRVLGLTPVPHRARKEFSRLPASRAGLASSEPAVPGGRLPGGQCSAWHVRAVRPGFVLHSV